MTVFHSWVLLMSEINKNSVWDRITEMAVRGEQTSTGRMTSSQACYSERVSLLASIPPPPNVMDHWQDGVMVVRRESTGKCPVSEDACSSQQILTAGLLNVHSHVRGVRRLDVHAQGWIYTVNSVGPIKIYKKDNLSKLCQSIVKSSEVFYMLLFSWKCDFQIDLFFPF